MATDRDNEYAMQHFGFQPAEPADDFSQSTMELLGSVLNAMKAKLVEKQPNIESDEMDHSFKKIEQLYTEKMERVFNKVGSYWAAHVFRIPPHVLLPEDEAWDGQTQAQVNKKLERAKVMMEEERDRIQNLIYKKEVLRRKLGKVDTAIVSQEQVLAEDQEVKYALDLDSLEDSLAAITLRNRSLLTRKANLRRAGEDLGIAGSQTSALGECRLFTRAKRQKIGEQGAQVAAQLGI